MSDSLPEAWRETAIPEAIVAAWRRSRAHGVDPDQPRFRRVSAAELAERLKDNALLIELAQPHLEWIGRALDHPHVIYLTDRDGIVLASRATRPEDLDTYGLRPGFDWSERQMGSNGAGTALASGKPVAVVGCAHYCRVWHSSTCLGAPVVLPNGEIVGAIDLSASAAEAIPAQLALVAHAAWGLGRELAARRALHARDAVLASVAHELRNALGVNQTAGRLLARLTSEEPAAQRALASLERSTSSMRRLVEDLLDAAAVESGRFRIEQRPARVRALADQALDTVQPLAEQRGVTLEPRIDDIGVVQCDGPRIVQVLVNLLKNAVEHSPAGAPVSLAARSEGEVVRFTVSDRGPGIPAEKLPSLFDAAPRAGLLGKHGMRLGLRISRGIVEAHGGHLEVRSSSEGTEVSFTLPG